VEQTQAVERYETMPDAIRQQWVEMTDAGYSLSMENLKAYLEHGSL
jgi:hypothetical protein